MINLFANFLGREQVFGGVFQGSKVLIAGRTFFLKCLRADTSLILGIFLRTHVSKPVPDPQTKIITSAEREVNDSRRSGMYQS